MSLNEQSPVVLTGDSLTLDDLCRVARRGEMVRIASDALERMRASREVVEEVLETGGAAYGLNTGVGVRKRVRLGADTTAGVRPQLAEEVVAALNDGRIPPVRIFGSIGQADVGPMADVAHGLFGEFKLAAKEGLGLINNNAFSTGYAAIAVADAARLIDTLDVAASLELEAFGANVDSLNQAVAQLRPYPGLASSLEAIRANLAGSYLFSPGSARNLQDPMTFRSVPHVHGAFRDALVFAQRQLSIELNASQDNPIVLLAERRIISVSNFDIVPLAAALDFLRIALAPVLTSACERIVKLLQSPMTGLPEGLAAESGLVQDGLSMFGVAAQAVTMEARLLAQPVSFEIVSSTDAEGFEDRATMAPLGARRLAEMVSLGERLVAIALVVAAQAVDLRAKPGLGSITRGAYELLRAHVGFVGADDVLPQDLDPVVRLISAGAFCAPALSS